MHEVKRYEFEGRTVEPRVENGEEVFSFADVRTLCGYADARAAMRAFKRHRSEFAPEDTVMVVTPATVGRRSYTAQHFRASGLYVFGLVAGTDVGARLRTWVMQTFIRPHLSGARVVPADRLAAFETALEKACSKTAAAVAARYDAVIAQQGSSIAALARLGEVQASNAGRMLSLLARDPEVRRVIDAERDRRNGVNRLPFPDGDVAPSTN